VFSSIFRGRLKAYQILLDILVVSDDSVVYANELILFIGTLRMGVHGIRFAVRCPPCMCYPNVG
jgi:hypothetical protein